MSQASSNISGILTSRMSKVTIYHNARRKMVNPDEKAPLKLEGSQQMGQVGKSKISH